MPHKRLGWKVSHKQWSVNSNCRDETKCFLSCLMRLNEGELNRRWLIRLQRGRMLIQNRTHFLFNLKIGWFYVSFRSLFFFIFFHAHQPKVWIIFIGSSIIQQRCNRGFLWLTAGKSVWEHCKSSLLYLTELRGGEGFLGLLRDSTAIKVFSCRVTQILVWHR